MERYLNISTLRLLSLVALCMIMSSCESGGSTVESNATSTTTSGTVSFADNYLSLNTSTDATTDTGGSTTPAASAQTIVFVRIAAGSSQLSTTDQVTTAGTVAETDAGFLATQTFANNYYISAYELTQGQWSQLVAHSGVSGVAATPWTAVTPGADFGPITSSSAPAYGLSYDDIQAVLSAWNARPDSPLTLRLPTGAEWEYACRGGDSSSATRFAWGDSTVLTVVDDFAVVRPTAGSIVGVRAVGQLSANASGLFDLHGNVWEWVSDGGVANGPSLRGGSWADDLHSAAIGNRLVVDNSTPFATAGVRLIAENP